MTADKAQLPICRPDYRLCRPHHEFAEREDIEHGADNFPDDQKCPDHAVVLCE
jgi:hypothetical protein